MQWGRLRLGVAGAQRHTAFLGVFKTPVRVGLGRNIGFKLSLLPSSFHYKFVPLVTGNVETKQLLLE